MRDKVHFLIGYTCALIFEGKKHLLAVFGNYEGEHFSYLARSTSAETNFINC